MLTREELAETPVDFNLYQKEKDYLQHIVLSRIYSWAGTGFTFKGGTSLQKCYGLDRFSEDLDFTAAGEFKKESIEKSLEEVRRYYPATIEQKDNPFSVSYRLKIEGPLYHGPLSLQTIRVEISMRENVLLETINRTVTPLYGDLRPYTVLFMNPREILAEKIMALMTRTKTRDLYDVNFLIRKKVELDVSLVEKKLDYYSMKYDEEALMKKR
ncbi:hypothetical protein IX51_01300 [uncultured archaeon]|nr:hypothetical protein IX51_01300 [uncultured archaeon]